MSVDVSPFEAAPAAGTSALRAEGVARLVAARLAGQTVALDIEESGPLRLRFPRITAADTLEAVLVNTGGGILGGDRLDCEIVASEGASVAVTTQAAEKIYRSDGPTSNIKVRLSAHARARLAWLPQETILFNRARVMRSIEAEVAGDAALTLCESIVFGRTAMGERVHTGSLNDRWRIRREGRLIFVDALMLDGPVERILSRPVVAAGASAVATIVHVAPDAETRSAPVRTTLAGQNIEAGASSFDGILVARLLAADGLSLRNAILATLSALGTVPPRAFTL